MSNITPVQKLKSVLNANSVQEQFKNALKESSNLFVASLIDLYSTDKYLQECDPNKVIVEALKAATLKLPINKSLGFAYIVPFKKDPTFIMGYKGYIQLAMRTGQYKYLNAGPVYEGEFVKEDKLTGEVDLTGTATSNKVVGYFAHMQMLNGFTKTVFWSRDKVVAHGKKFSKSFNHDSSAWKTNFDEMAIKTVIRHLLGHFGFLSIEMAGAFTADASDDVEAEVQSKIATQANSDTIDVEAETVKEADTKDNAAQGPDF